MKKIISLLITLIAILSYLFALSSCSSSQYIYSGDEDFELYSGYWKVIKYDFAEFGEIDAEDIEDFAVAFNYDEVIDYIYMVGIRVSDTTKYQLTATIKYLNGSSSGFISIKSIDNGIRLREVDFLWENDLLVCGSDEFKMYLQKVESIED